MLIVGASGDLADLALPRRRVYARATNQVPPRRANVRGRGTESFHSRRARNPSRADSGSFLVRATLSEPPTTGGNR
jgi:hypothetical protein